MDLQHRQNDRDGKTLQNSYSFSENEGTSASIIASLEKKEKVFVKE